MGTGFTRRLNVFFGFDAPSEHVYSFMGFYATFKVYYSEPTQPTHQGI